MGSPFGQTVPMLSTIEFRVLFGNDIMAAALIDRLLHHCHIVTSAATATGCEPTPNSGKRCIRADKTARGAIHSLRSRAHRERIRLQCQGRTRPRSRSRAGCRAFQPLPSPSTDRSATPSRLPASAVASPSRNRSPQVHEPGPGWHAGSVGQPDPVRLVGLELAFDPVRHRLTQTKPTSRIRRATRLRPTGSHWPPPPHRLRGTL